MGKPQKQVDVLNDVWDDVNHRLRTDATLETEDIEIGAVEIKDATSDHRAVVDSTGALKTTAIFTPSGTLDVNVTNESLAVTGDFYPTTQEISATDLDIRNLDKTIDSVKAEISNLPNDYAKDSSLTNLSNLDVLLSSRLKPADTLTKVSTIDTITNAVTVQATDLDIHDLVSTRDSVEVKQATASNLNANVSATHLDIRHLNSTDDIVNVSNMIPSVETGLAKDNTLTNGTQRTKLTDGINDVTVTNNRLDVNALVGSIVAETEWSSAVRQGKAFRSSTGIITTSTTNEQPFMLLKNPIGSGKTIRIKYMIILSPTGSAKLDIHRIYRNPTITTNGTALTIEKLLTSGSMNSVLENYKIPTISANGTDLLSLGGNINVYEIRDLDFSINLEQGENIIITIEPSANNTPHKVQFLWAEFVV